MANAERTTKIVWRWMCQIATDKMENIANVKDGRPIITETLKVMYKGSKIIRTAPAIACKLPQTIRKNSKLAQIRQADRISTVKRPTLTPIPKNLNTETRI